IMAAKFMGEYKSRRPRTALSCAVRGCAVWFDGMSIAYFGATLPPDACPSASAADTPSGGALGASGSSTAEEDPAGAAASKVAGAEVAATICGAFAVPAGCDCAAIEAPIKVMARASVVADNFIVSRA